eukprot:CAMPEP_0172689662 /NCGR_PEP_ID=MMETSP1074-20121228/23302_1 /TAXON_ID=2916 /ORGANISM="Ceratium fusus, Strain PA161109" /LENGTH=101 /DNA_ID=CAMNT_0013509497 /DNA_START=407 /DNA_END=712 /DNA_ORIENTATION=-
MSCAKLFTITPTELTNSVSGMLSGGRVTVIVGVGCHGTALGFKLVNPGRTSQHGAKSNGAKSSTGMLCQGTGGDGGSEERRACFVLSSSSASNPNAEGKLA